MPARSFGAKPHEMSPAPRVVATAPIIGLSSCFHKRGKQSTVSVPMSESELHNWYGQTRAGQNCHGHFYRPPLPSNRRSSEFDNIGMASTTDCRAYDDRQKFSRKLRKKLQATVITVDPWKVMFSNPRINDCFSCGRSLADTIKGLQNGSVTVEDVPKIRVIQQRDRFVTLDHRRLYCFRAALPLGTEIPVLLLKQPWLGPKYVVPDAPVYDAVCVEEDYLEHAALNHEAN